MPVKCFLGLLVIGNFAWAEFYEWDNPNKSFDTGVNKRTESTIKWIPVDDVIDACNKESKKRGFGGFDPGAKFAACSFYNGNQCTIITSKTPSMHTLGHEMRHCYQGNWHE
jgi:hypothetical protein